MKVLQVTAKNFKSLKNIKLQGTRGINVIVGPNAVGKSTIFEAVRLAKVLLASRTQNEAQQALIGLSAISPHAQVIGSPGVDLAVLANDPEKEIEIDVKIAFSSEEVSSLKTMQSQFGMLTLQNSMASSGNDSPLAFTQYLSTVEGQQKLADATSAAFASLSRVNVGHEATLGLRMDAQKATLRGMDAFGQTAISLLDRRLPAQKTLFSLFSADRQFPSGEQNLQLGSADTQNQILSYMGTPSIKYARLKQVIIQNITMGIHGLGAVEQEFNLIFDQLLPGKQLHGININALGLLKVLVKEVSTDKVFDIDQMSSGEKGLVLTFLFVRLSIEKGGVVLLDEPELHLNAAVQAKLFPFIKKYCVEEKGIQVFVCTHSPEIVRSAFEDDDTSLYHLRSGLDLTPILIQDHRELFAVFDRLGNSPADVLFNKGNIYVEGPDDNQILQAGYGEAIMGFKVNALGGRGEVEKEIKALQSEENAGRLPPKKQLFILDNDRKPTALASSPFVKIHQHQRYCFENYLLDEEIIFDLLVSHASDPPQSRGSFSAELEEIALSQIPEMVLKSTYLSMRPASVELQSKDINGKSIQEVAEFMMNQMLAVRAFVDGAEAPVWTSNFAMEALRKKTEYEAIWRSTWKSKASGKKIIDDLYVKYEINLRKSDLKKELIKRMAVRKTDDWKVLDQVLRVELVVT